VTKDHAELMRKIDEANDRLHVLHHTNFPAEQVLVRRLVELELHHTDLDAGYRAADWLAEFATMELPEPMRTQREDRQSR
jgi:maleylpyruvate isomerase